MAAKKTTNKDIANLKLSNNKLKISNHVSIYTRTSYKSQDWVKEIHKDLKWLNADNVYHLLRAVLQSLRDQMSINETAHFAAQLPLLLRGTFYEGWNPQTVLCKGTTKEYFLETVKNKMGPVGVPRFKLESDVLIVLNVIKKYISAGEMIDVVGTVNPSLKDFIEKNIPQSEISY